jgi:hypothetical protein
MKTRKVNIKQRIRRNKTIRGGDLTPVILGDTPPPDALPRIFKHKSHTKMMSPVPISRSEDFKHGEFLDKNDEYLNQILKFTNTTKAQFKKFVDGPDNPSKDDVKMFFKDRLISYLQTPRFITKQVNILKSHFNTDDFDGIMVQYVGGEEERKEWFR